MTVLDLLRGLEPAVFGSTPERSWLLRERVAAWTRPSVLSEAVAVDAGSTRAASLSAPGVRPNPSASGALFLVPVNDDAPPNGLQAGRGVTYLKGA